MAVIRSSEAQRFELPGVTFTTLVSPVRGGANVALWNVQLAPGTPGQEHRLTHQEVIHVLRGEAVATLAGKAEAVRAGDTIVVPADTPFALENRGPAAFEAIALLPPGSQAIIEGTPPFTPPWTL
jgi:quercetin dioxygenase-like cupin family protein